MRKLLIGTLLVSTVAAAVTVAEEPQRYRGLTQADWKEVLIDLAPGRRLIAIEALTHFDVGGAAAIISALRDSDDRVSRAAALSLFRLGPYAMIPALAESATAFDLRSESLVLLDALLLASEEEKDQMRTYERLRSEMYGSTDRARPLLKEFRWTEDAEHRERVRRALSLAGCQPLSGECRLVEAIRQERAVRLPPEMLRLMLGFTEVPQPAPSPGP